MKNKKILILIISLLLVVFSTVIMSTKNVFADQNPSIIVAYGESKIIVDADSCSLNFGINISSEKYIDGKNKIDELYENAKTRIGELNPENSIYRTYFSCYPIRNGQIDGYDFCYNFSVLTKDLLKIDEIIDAMHDCGVFAFYGSDFSLENKDAVYAEALKKASDDASKKAHALNPSSEIKAIIETNIYSYSNDRNVGQIVIEAKVKALYAEMIGTLDPTV